MFKKAYVFFSKEVVNTPGKFMLVFVVKQRKITCCMFFFLIFFIKDSIKMVILCNKTAK